MRKALKILIIVATLLAVLIPAGLTIASSTDAIEYPSGNRYYPGDEILEERGRAHKTYYEGSGTYRAEFVSSPEFTKSDNQWVDYVFVDKGTYYQIQHPWSSARFYDYYTEVWNEEFTEVKIYDDRWVVEYKNKKGDWIDADFYNITRSYEEVADGIKLKRTGSTDIGPRQEIYFFRNGSPCKIEIRQTCNEAQTVRFVWKPSGIVADSEKKLKDISDNKTVGLNFYNSDGDFVQTIRWYEEWETCDNITPIAETHAQGRKATVTFSEFSITAGGTAILDPMTFYPDADVETTSVDGFVGGGAPDSTWAAVRGHAGAESSDSGNGAQVYFLADADANLWNWLRRSIILFDTSGLPDSAVVTATTLSLYGLGKADPRNNTPLINIYSSDPFSNIALQNDDFVDVGSTAFCDTAITYAGWNTGAPGAPNDFAFNATGIAAISLTGITKTGVREVTYDVGGAIPAWGNADETYMQFWAADKGVGYKPMLVVTFSTPPTVVTDNATSIGQTTATLGGNVTAINDGSIVERGFVWDTANRTDPGNVHPASSNYTWNWTEVGVFGTGVFSHAILGLSANTTYYFRAAANNTAFWAYGNELSFLTASAPPSPPPSLTLTDMGATSINMTWGMGAGSTYTMIRASRTDCPTTASSGELVYYGDNVTANVSGYALDTSTYYFSAWGFLADNVTYSADYICASIGGEGMAEVAENLWLFVLVLLPLGLTVAMFATRNAMLGFPCGIFWAIFGAACFLESTTPWGDIYFYLFFASAFGMVIFTILAAFGLREKRDTLADEEIEEESKEPGYYDEGKDKTSDPFAIEDTSKPSKRIRALRERAKQRRTRGD